MAVLRRRSFIVTATLLALVVIYVAVRTGVQPYRLSPATALKKEITVNQDEIYRSVPVFDSENRNTYIWMEQRSRERLSSQIDAIKKVHPDFRLISDPPLRSKPLGHSRLAISAFKVFWQGQWIPLTELKSTSE